MFCGWQLVNDFPELQKLKNGELIINVKTGGCTYNGAKTDKLTMPLVLNDWFYSDLKQNSIPIDDIELATLKVKFNMYDFGNKKGKPPEFICESLLKSGNNEYSLKYKGEHGSNEVAIT